jgi:hypothetical protein
MKTFDFQINLRQFLNKKVQVTPYRAPPGHLEWHLLFEWPLTTYQKIDSDLIDLVQTFFVFHTYNRSFKYPKPIIVYQTLSSP